METRTYKVYKFNELTESQQQKAIENYRDINTDFDWWDCEYDDAKEIGKLIGFDIDKIYFSGFSSQGDGACFEGSFYYEKSCVKAVKAYAPLDTELHRIADAWYNLQRKYFYQISGSVKQSGHYMHENCTDFTVNTYDYEYSDCFSEIEDGTKEIMRDYMRWIYKQLEKQYDYLSSEQAIIETIEANDYNFTEDGKIDY